jgi:hypothetical protein
MMPAEVVVAMKNASVVLAMGVAIGGCGSSLTDAPATAAEACVQLQEVSARYAARCNGGSAADWKAYTQSWQGTCASYKQHVAAGRVQYRPQGFAACLAEYEKPCDQPLSSCAFDILHGLVPDGAHCQSAVVCGLESTCLMLEGSGTCGEVCARAPRENEACGLYCDDGPTPCFDFPVCFFDLACVNDVCVKARTAGQPCGPSDPVPCSPLLHCTADPADPLSTGTCVERGTGGCWSDADCRATDFCLQGTCAARRAVGQSCSDAPTGCEPFSQCDAVRGSCIPAGKPGSPCLAFPGESTGTYCLIGSCGPEGTCVATSGPGDSCAQSICETGSSCDSASLMCVACPP